MNNVLRGCLVSVGLLILVGLGVFFFIINEINKSISSDKLKVEEAWNVYANQLHSRDIILLRDKDLNILSLINKSEKNIQNGEKEDLLSNEYVLNDSLRLSRNQKISSINENLNQALLKYNLNVKEFNVKYSVFPNSYIRRNKGIDLYDYYYIEYGNDNTELINEKEQADQWIKNGGEFK